MSGTASFVGRIVFVDFRGLVFEELSHEVGTMIWPASLRLASTVVSKIGFRTLHQFCLSGTVYTTVILPHLS
jgi:hypothetical protein